VKLISSKNKKFTKENRFPPDLRSNLKAWFQKAKNGKHQKKSRIKSFQKKKRRNGKPKGTLLRTRSGT
jgi:hypothetical protein